MDENLEKHILSCIEESMQAESFIKMKIDLTGSNEKGEGYMADFVFATVTGSDTDNKQKEVHLAIKFGKRNKEFRKKTPVIMECYQRELFFYDKVLPTFREFQLEKNIVNTFDGVPKCYLTFLSDNLEALVLENLKQKGFALHDSKKPMNFQHLRLVLENYAKFHALSFSLRDQNEDLFNKLTADYYSVGRKMIPEKKGTNNMVQMELIRAGRDDLAEKYVKKTDADKRNILIEVLDNVPQESVIIHADCHNNNFLFEYQDSDERNPLSVAIIDWQISGLHSPAMDISYFLYSCASEEGLSRLDELLKFYHSQLTNFMREMGSDAEKLFPYSVLIEHWKRYSLFSLIVSTNVLKLFHVEKEEVLSIEENDTENIFERFDLKHIELYRQRIISIVEHHFNFVHM